MVALCACWCPSSTSIRAPNGSMAWSLWSATARVSGSSAATITTPIHGKRNGTGKKQAAKKFVAPRMRGATNFLTACLFLQGALTITFPIIREQNALALVEGLQVDGAAPHGVNMLESLFSIDQVE